MKSKISKAILVLCCCIGLVFSGSLAAHANESETLQVSAGDATPAIATPSSFSTYAAEESILSSQGGAITHEPIFAWGAVIKVLTSKPACEAAKAFYNTTFPNYPKLKCRKAGKVWLLTR